MLKKQKLILILIQIESKFKYWFVDELIMNKLKEDSMDLNHRTKEYFSIVYYFIIFKESLFNTNLP